MLDEDPAENGEPHVALVTIHYHLRRICISSRRSANPLLFANKVRSDVLVLHPHVACSYNGPYV